MNNDGWVKATDPNTGKTFYANHNTRQTQWNPPPGFVDPDSTPPPPPPPPMPEEEKHQWEMMHDKATGRPFYVDHVTKKTTWDRPSSYNDVRTAASVNNSASSSSNNNNNGGRSKNTLGGTATGFGFIPDGNSKHDSSSRGPSSDPYNPSNPSSDTSNYDSKPISKYTYTPSSSFPTATAAKHERTTPTPTPTLHHSPAEEDDMSALYYLRSTPTSLPHVDFKNLHISNSLRSSCPSCGITFSLTVRRHHCRLCGDVFCDACSGKKVQLPLEGVKYDKPVRVCDSCHVDCGRGNYFSMRRYLTPLQLFDDNIAGPLLGRGSGKGFSLTGSHHGRSSDGEEKDGEYVSSEHVKGALSSISSDLDGLLSDPTEFEGKITIPSNVLVPSMTRHLGVGEVDDRAVRAVANLVALGNVVGDNSFAHVMYCEPEAGRVWEDLFGILERNGSRMKVLAMQEQAARVLFYLTDGNVIRDLLQMDVAAYSTTRTPVKFGVDATDLEYEAPEWKDPRLAIREFDVHRALRNMLDHTTNSNSPSLRRWAAACIRNLIAEDHRRACDAVTEAMTMGDTSLSHESFLEQLVDGGGIMILSSLMGSDDGDTRAHVTAALSATITSAREVETRRGVWREAFGIGGGGNEECSDAKIIEAIVGSGACGLSLAQLLLSADDTVAAMGCSFANSLVHPIVTHPEGSELTCYHRFLSSNSGGEVKVDEDEDGLSAYRKAALDLAINDGVLTALVQLIRKPMGNNKRPMDLQKSAMEVLAAVTLTLSYWDGRLKSAGSLIEGDKDWENLMMQLQTVQHELEQEQVGEVILTAYCSNSAQSINTSRDSSASQLREAACLVLGSLASFSDEIASYLIHNNTLTKLLSVAADEGMDSNSVVRGEWSSRNLAMLEAASSILVAGWKDIQSTSITSKEEAVVQDRSAVRGFGRYGGGGGGGGGHHHQQSFSQNSAPLDLLLEALDAGVVPLVSRILDTRIDYHENTSACSGIRLKIACSNIIAALFGICQCDTTNIGNVRLYEAIEVNASNWGQNMISSSVSLLQASTEEAKNYMGRGHGEDVKLPILTLVQASLLALGSICGASYCSFARRGSSLSEDNALLQKSKPSQKEHEFSSQVQMAAISACDVLVSNSFLSSTLVGVFGEGSVVPALRLAAAMAKNGPETVHGQLARTGFLVPITDMLREAIVAGDFFTFKTTLTILSHCGPHITASSGGNANTQCLHDTIDLLSNVLGIQAQGKNDDLAALKMECIFAVEQLSSNSALWNTIAATFVPRASEYLFENLRHGSDSSNVGAALRAIQRVVSLPSNAQAVANSGICEALCEIICEQNANDNMDRGPSDGDTSDGDDVGLLALQMLHSLAPHIATGRNTVSDSSGLLHCGAVEVSCFVLSKHLSGDKDTENTKLGLELLQLLIAEVDHAPEHKRDACASLFVEAITKYPSFIKSLCATLLEMMEDGTGKEVLQPQTKHLYGAPLPLYTGECGNFSSPLNAAVSTLFSLATYCTLGDAKGSNMFWSEFFLENVDELTDSKSKQEAIITACALFLSAILDEEGGLCVPKDPTRLEYYHNVSLQIVRERLLNGLSACLDECKSLSDAGEQNMSSSQGVLCHFDVPQTCLVMCSNPKSLDPAFRVVESLVSAFPNETIESFCSQKQSLSTIFELLSMEACDDEWVDTKPERIRQVAAISISTAAKNGLLGPVTKSLGLRSIAIASLTAACLMDEQDTGDCIEEDLVGSGSSIATMCIRGLVGVLCGENENDKIPQIVMTPGEASAISSSLGKKLSDMILARFVGHAEVHDLDMSVTESSEVLLLCALASLKEALPNLCANGGLEALSLVAAEGEPSAIFALHEACTSDPSLIIDVEGHLSVMQVLASANKKTSSEVQVACMSFITTLCKTKQGRVAVSDAEELCDSCISFVSKAIHSSTPNGNSTKANSDDEDSRNEVEGDKLPTEKKTKSTNDIHNMLPLLLATLSFLSALVRIPACREIIFEDKQLQEDIQYFASESQYFDLQNEAVKFLSTSARYMKHSSNNNENEGEREVVESIIPTFLSVIKSSNLLRANTKSNKSGIHDTYEINQNLVQANACSSIEELICSISLESQTEVLSSLMPLFRNVIDYAIAPGKKVERKIRNSGVLMYNITSIFLQLLGIAECQQLLRNAELISSCFKFSVMNPPKSLKEEIRDDDKMHWEGALNQTLKFLSIVTLEVCPCSNDETAWDDLISQIEDSLMEKRKTSRFRKYGSTRNTVAQEPESRDSLLLTSLRGFASDSSDSTRSIAAERIIAHLELS